MRNDILPHPKALLVNKLTIQDLDNGDNEYKKLKPTYFGVGDLSVSNNDKLLAYSLDLKGSEYYDIHIRKINNKKKLRTNHA